MALTVVRFINSDHRQEVRFANDANILAGSNEPFGLHVFAALILAGELGEVLVADDKDRRLLGHAIGWYASKRGGKGLSLLAMR